MLLFILELVLKMIVLGPFDFFKSSFNVFDFIVILGSVVDVIVRFTVGEALGFSILRALRLLRIFKVTR